MLKGRDLVARCFSPCSVGSVDIGGRDTVKVFSFKTGDSSRLDSGFWYLESGIFLRGQKAERGNA